MPFNYQFPISKLFCIFTQTNEKVQQSLRGFPKPEITRTESQYEILRCSFSVKLENENEICEMIVYAAVASDAKKV